ncbi:acyltransferase family protein [Acidisoma sp. 7E03]
MPQRLLALDGLRGLLALYILAGHTLPFLFLPPSVSWIAGLVSHGRAAVDLFFALSGFVILHALEPQAGTQGWAAAGRFLALRAGRLLPVYFLALALACGALAAGDPFPAMPWLGAGGVAHAVLEPGWPPQPWLHLLAHLLMLHSLLPPRLLPGAEYALLGPAWSLGTEWQFYTLMAVCLAAAPALLTGGTGRLVALLLLLGLGGLGISALPDAWRFGRAFLPREAWYFALGLASHGWLSRRLRPLPFMAVVIVAIGMSAAAREPGGGWGATAVPLVWILCLRAQQPRWRADHGLRRLLTWPPLLWCGGLSYSLYLLHAPVQRLLMLALAPLAHGDGPLFTLIWGPAALLLPLAVAALVHRTVEEPCRRWSRARILGAARPRVTPFGSGSNTSVAGRP